MPGSELTAAPPAEAAVFASSGGNPRKRSFLKIPEENDLTILWL